MSEHFERERAVLVGLAAGDMLGAPMEFRTPAAVRELYGELRGPVAHSQGVFAAGEFTDDTQMALCLLAAYPRDEGLAARALWACHNWLEQRPRDVGGLTARALRSSGVQAWRESGRQSCGNGALMRAAASVVAGIRGDELLGDSLVLGALTHADPRSLFACAVYCLALRTLVEQLPYDEAWAVALAAARTAPLENLLASFGAEYVAEVEARRASAWDEVAAAVQAGLAGRGGGNSGYAVSTLQTAIAHGRAASFAGGVLPIAAEGDDADTVAAVCGAILGARGLTPPEDWLTELRSGECFAAWPVAARGAVAVERLGRMCLAARAVSRPGDYPPGLPSFAVRRAHPQVFYGRNPLFAVEVEALAARGVTHLIDLREAWEWSGPGRLGAEAVAACARIGVERLHLPVADGDAPDSKTLSRAVDFLDRVLGGGGLVFVHCRAGVERTGSVLLAWWLSHGGDLEQLQALGPALAPLPGQQRAVYDWLRQRLG